MEQKVVAYLVRARPALTELLVFEHTDENAGVQVPKGTIDKGETPEQALLRELSEEAGIDNVRNLTQLDTMIHRDEKEPEEWHLFAGIVDPTTPDIWDHRVTGAGDDAGLRFRYYWLPLTPEPKLAGEQAVGLAKLHAFLKNQTRVR